MTPKPPKGLSRALLLQMALIMSLALVGCRNSGGPEWLVENIECARGPSPVAAVSLDWESTTWPILGLSLTQEVEGWVRFGTEDDPLQVTPAYFQHHPGPDCTVGVLAHAHACLEGLQGAAWC